MENRHPQILTLPSALEKALRVMATVCGWVVMFRILLGFIMPPLTRITSADHAVFLTGLLDLANGCLELGKIPDTGVKLVTASAMLSFGGLCVAMQTCSVCQDLSMKYYLSGKLIQAAVSILLISILVSGFAIGDLPSWTVAAIFPGIMAALNLRISAKIRVAFRR